MDIPHLIMLKKLTYDCSINLLTNWTDSKDKYGRSWFVIGQVNAIGQPHGICRMIYSVGSVIREGQFINGELSGYGRHIGIGGYYVGDYLADKYHGSGELFFYKDSLYIGGWSDGNRHGFGKYTNKNGVVSEG